VKLAPKAFFEKHKLPDCTQWIVLDDEVTATDVRVAMHERLLAYTEFLRQIIWPDGLSAVAEASVFSEHERSEAHALYNTTMLLVKDCSVVELECTDASEIALLQKLAQQWPALVNAIRPLIIRTRDAYATDAPGKGFVSYLG
jgi:hypothetical protein